MGSEMCIRDRSSTVQHLLDEAKAAIVKSQGKDDGRILHLHHGGQVLSPHRHLGDAGVVDGAVLTLISESAPLKLSMIDRYLSHMHASAAAQRLESELVERDAAVAAAQDNRQKAAVAMAAANKQLGTPERTANLARNAFAMADGVLRKAESKRWAARGELERAKQDQRQYYDRILDKLEP